MTISRIIHIFLITVFLIGAFCAGALFFVMHNYSIDFSTLSCNSGRPSILLDDEGNEWGRFQLDRRDPVEGVKIPPHLINAFIAAEDWDFFSHGGISWKGIIRSIFVNLYHGRKAQGASTITQQLVKLLFFDSQKTFTRKIKEQIYAILVEQQLTKEQILTTYLNNVCFGCGIYGIEAASQRFWCKHAHEVTIDEAATLAGIIRSPARHCVLTYPLSAQKRRDVVLGKMKYLGFITLQEYDDARAKVVEAKDKNYDLFAAHVKEMLRASVEAIVGKTALYCAGLQIQTTINSQMQLTAENIFKTEMGELRKKFGDELDGGFIVIDRKMGEIKALVGGCDFHLSKWNRVTQAHRQIGSIIKPLIYAAAIQQGMSFADTEIDEPTQWGLDGAAWAPNNYDKKFNGQITLAYALSHSNNIVTIKTFLRVGARSVIELAKKCRLKCNFHTYPSLALGTVDATLYESAGMFNVFANDGIYVAPHLLSWIKDRWGTRIYKETIETERVIDSRVVGQVTAALCLGPERLKRMYGPDNWIKPQVISKTGTTNDSRVCLYIGSTPTLTAAVSVAFDDNRSMGHNVYPIHTAFPIWYKFNRALNENAEKFSYDPSLQEQVIDERTGDLVIKGSPGAISILK